MPTLPLARYTAKPDGGTISGGRRATGEDFGAVDLTGAVRSVQGAAEAYVAQKEEDESRSVLVQQAEIRAKYAKRLDEAATNGEDVTKIRSELDNDLAKVGEGLTTRRGADTAQLHAANTSAVFDNQANNILVSRAVTQARVDGAKFLNSTGAIVASNPAYLPQAEKDVDAFVETLSRVPPEKRAAMAADLKQNMNVAAAMGAARLDPEGTKLAIEAGKFDMTPEQRQQVVGQADATIRAKRVEEGYVRAEKEYKERERDETARDKHFKGIMAGTTSARAILDDPDLRPATREHLVSYMEARTKSLAGADKRSNPGAVRDLWMRINAPDGDPNKIYGADPIFEAVKKGDINTTDADRLNSQLANSKDENNRSFSTRLNGRLQTVASAMRSSPVYQNQPELAAAIQNTMIAEVERESLRLRKEGKNPDVLLDPNSKDYYFTPNRIKTVADDVQKQAAQLNPSSVDLRTKPDAAMEISVGQPFIDPNGVQRTMTKELQEALRKNKPGINEVRGTIRQPEAK